MSLRARIFVLFGAVMALLLAAQWWLVTTLRSDLRAESTQSALEVGSSLLDTLEGRPIENVTMTPLVPAVRLTKSMSGGAPTLEVQVQSRPFAASATHAAAQVPMQSNLPARKIRVPTERLDALGARFQTKVAIGSLAILGLGLVVAAFLAKRVTAPLRDLARAAEAVGQGHFGVQARQVGEQSLDATIASFNKMSARLQELDSAARDAQARTHLTEIGEIARGIAHSLRNPLHVVGLTLSGIAATKPGSTDLEPLLSTAKAQVDAIDRTLRLFLTMTAGSGGQDLEVDMVAVAQDVALEAAQMVGSEIRIDLNAGKLRPQLLGVPAELRAALHVLVVNAVEASSPGDTVWITIEVEGDAVRLVVEDQGPGIPAEVRPRLFQPHVTTKERGTGFGLFLAERIAARRYRGSLALVDREPHGTRAVLTLRSAAGGAHG